MTDLQEQLRSALAHSYDIERELTGAGMSRVFVAVERALGRRVVIKVLPPDLAAGVNSERFRREIQLSAQLNHPHIVPVLTSGEIGDLLYYTMPYMEGESLNIAVERHGPLAPAEVLRILHDVVDAIAYAHSRGVIHRDIKPANILSLGTHSLVTDFGVAKAISASMPSTGMTSGGFAIGTPAYMAPEQLAADPQADHRVDIYAAGLLAYELLTGTSPFTGTSPQATMAAQLTRVPEPIHKLRPDVPAPLSTIIQRCLEKLPENRFATAADLLRELDAVAAPHGAFAVSRPTLTMLVTNPRQHIRYLAALSATVVVVGFSLFGLGTFFMSKSREFRAAQAATVGETRPPLTTVAGDILQRDQRAMNALSLPSLPEPPQNVVTEEEMAAYADSIRSQILAELRRDAAAMNDSIRDAIERQVIDSLTRLRDAAARVIGGAIGQFAGGRTGGAAPGPGRGGPTDLRRPPPPGERRVLVPDFGVRLSAPDSQNVAAALADSLRMALAETREYRGVSTRAAREAAGSDDIRVMVDNVHAGAVLIGTVLARRGDSAVVRLLFSEPARTQQPRPIASVVTPISGIYAAIDSLLPAALDALRGVNWPTGRLGRRGGGPGEGRGGGPQSDGRRSAAPPADSTPPPGGRAGVTDSTAHMPPTAGDSITRS